MKAFEPYINYNFIYPDDMKMIIDYLESKGKLNVPYSYLEVLYGQFSDECFCAGWMIPDAELLNRFAKWLSEQDI